MMKWLKSYWKAVNGMRKIVSGGMNLPAGINLGLIKKDWGAWNRAHRQMTEGFREFDEATLEMRYPNLKEENPK